MELIDVLDENRNNTGKILSREEVHKRGLWPKTVHIWVINKTGDILLLKRSPMKKTSPNMWTTSVSGHLSAGDSSIEGAIRELKEEIGIEAKPEELKYLFTVSEEVIKENNIKDREHIDVYVLHADINIDKLILQEEEVSKVKWFSFTEFEKMVNNHDKNLVKHDEIHEKIIKILKDEV